MCMCVCLCVLLPNELCGWIANATDIYAASDLDVNRVLAAPQSSVRILRYNQFNKMVLAIIISIDIVSLSRFWFFVTIQRVIVLE